MILPNDKLAERKQSCKKS